MALNTRYERILRLLTCLQSGPRYNAVQLADEMHVSRRTVFRDICLLRDSGVPVRFDEEHGRYHIAPSFSVPTMNALTNDEAAILLLAAQLSMAMHVPEIASVVNRAAAKMLSGFSSEQRTEISILLNACEAHLPADRPVVQNFKVLETIFAAIRSRRQLRLMVAAEAPAEPWFTKVAPYQLALTVDHWALIGRSSVHRGPWSFDLRRILGAEILNEPFVLPRGYHQRTTRSQSTGQSLGQSMGQSVGPSMGLTSESVRVGRPA